MILCRKKPVGDAGFIMRYMKAGLLRHHLSQLNEQDAGKLRRYAESQGINVDDETYCAALNAEQECRAEIARDQM